MPPLGLSAYLFLALAPGRSAPGVSAEGFGFAGFEIYKVHDGIFDLGTGDVDGDGRVDVALVDNARSRIEVFLRLAPSEPDRFDPPGADSINEPRFDGRFRRVTLPVERRVLRLVLADLDADGQADVVFATEGGELTFVSGASVGTGDSGRTRRYDELRAGCALLQTADLDADGRPELLAAGAEALLAIPLLASNAAGAGGLGDARVVDRVGGLGAVHVAELDGRAGADLLYVHLNEDYPLRFRLRQTDGSLGPRVDLDLPQLRSVEVLARPGGPAHVVGVYKLSGRVVRLVFESGAQAERGLLARYSFARDGAEAAERRSTGIAVGDLDADGTADVVVAEPKTAEVRVFFGTKGARVMRAERYPSLVGAAHPRIGDVDGDGQPELVVLSAPERMIGVTRLDEHGRLPFPTVVPVEGEPAAQDLADMDGDGRPDLVVVATRGEGRAREYLLETWLGGPAGFGAPQVLALADLKKIPSALLLADVDRDGRRDAVAFLPGDEPPVVLVRKDGGFVRDSRGKDAPGLGILGGVLPAQVALADCDRDGALELLVGSGNFARALYFDSAPDGALTPRVLEQFNGPAPDSRITGCAAADLDGDGAVEIVLRDERSVGHSGELLVLARDSAGGARVRERIDAGRLRFAGLAPADADGDGNTDLFVLGEDQFGVWFAGSDELAPRELASYEPEEERFYLDELAVGDLDADGEPDLVAIEAAEHALVILRAAGEGLAHGLGFRVFEEKAFAPVTQGREPREVVCADFSGDAKDDVAVLVHDKLILYIQE